VAAETLPSLADILAVLTFQAGYNTAVVMLGVSLLGLAAGTVGTFALLRGRALMGDTLAHAALPGICAAFLASVALGGGGRALPVLLAGAAVSGVLGVLVVQLVTRRTRLPEDAAMGAVLSVFFGAGFVLLSHIQTLGTGAEGGLATFVLGQTAAMSAGDALVIGLAALGAVLATVGLFKEFRLVCFDQGFATAQGWPISLIDLLMMALVVVVTVIGLQAVGLIMIVALVIVPAAAARFWSERLAVVAVLAAALGAASGYLGAALSALAPRVPAGAVIVLVAGAFFVVSLLLAPARGILPAGLRQLRLRLDIGAQHVLRSVFETFESEGGTPTGGVPLARLRAARAWGGVWLDAVLWRLRVQGLLWRDGALVGLTDRGRPEALRITRNHRLWERFLVSRAHLAPSHVDRSADLVEHVLSPELVAELERELAAAGRLPRHPAVPVSVHPLPVAGAAGASP
jgi:manganese/zinc/iron transport system permease protein